MAGSRVDGIPRTVRTVEVRHGASAAEFPERARASSPAERPGVQVRRCRRAHAGLRVTQARIRELGIPPAWNHVWTCASENGHLQAVGTDAAGDWTATRDVAKFDRILRGSLRRARGAGSRPTSVTRLPRGGVRWHVPSASWPRRSCRLAARSTRVPRDRAGWCRAAPSRWRARRWVSASGGSRA